MNVEFDISYTEKNQKKPSLFVIKTVEYNINKII